jgi:protocatechuate 3,4-dioxygenase beta subunit
VPEKRSSRTPGGRPTRTVPAEPTKVTGSPERPRIVLSLVRASWTPWLGVIVATLLQDASIARLSIPARRAASGAVSRANHSDRATATVRVTRARVRVTDAAGTSVPRAVIDVLWLVDGRAIPVARALAVSDGRAELTDLSVGRYLFIATSPGQSRATRTEELTDEQGRDVSLVTGPEATITGVVRRENGRRSEPTPVAGIVVRAVPDGGGSEPAFATRTAADGSYTLTGLRPGTFRVEIDHEAYEPVLRRAVPAPSRSVDLALRAFATIRGVVRDERGALVADARVSIAGSGVWPARAESTLADGSVRLSRVPSGVYELRAQHGSRVAEPIAPLVLDPGESRDVTFTVTEGAMLEGRVTDARTGAAVADARIIVAEDALSSTPRALVSEHDGAFRVQGLLRRPHVVSARAAGYVPRVGDPVTPGSAVPVAIALDREVSVVGRVVDSRGAPVANAQVEIAALDLDGRATFLNATARAFRDQLFERQQRGPGALRPSGELGVTTGRVPHIPTDPFASQSLPAPLATPNAAEPGAEAGFVTDAQGRFRVGEIPPGAVRVSASHPAYVRGESALRAARAGEQIELEVVLHEGGVIDGRLVDERGFPVGQQMIEVRIERDLAPRRAFTARDGTFRVPAVLGRASVVAVIAGRPAARAEVTVEDGAETRVLLELDSESRRVHGRVLDGSEYPVAGAEIVLAGGGHSARAISLADGTFEAVLAGRGAFSLEARHPRFAPRLVNATDASRELRVTLEPGGAVSARVDGRSCARTEIQVELRTTCGSLARTLRGEGELRFEQVCPGRVELAARADGCIPAGAPSAVLRGGQSIELARVELAAGGGAEGEVVDARGELVAGAVLSLADSRDGASLARTDRQGRFRAETLPEGDQTVVASHPVLGRSEPASVNVVRGTTARGLRLRFSRALEGASAEGDRRWLSLTASAGRVTVVRVDAGSPGARAGLREGDVVRSIDGRPVSDAPSAERRASSGEECVIEVERDGERRLLRLSP